MSFKMHSTIIMESIDSNFEPPYDGTVNGYMKKTISYFAPFFSISNKRLPRRILSSLAPPLFFPEFKRVYSDFKGPFTVLTFLFFILLYGIYTHEMSVFSQILTITKLTYVYWIFFSILACCFGYFCQTCLTFSQYCSISGYSFTGHCFVILLSEILHQESSYSVFFFLLTIFGGLSTGRVMIIMMARTPKPAQRLLMCSSLACINLMHLVYIHFAIMRKKLPLN